ncbi:MAG: cell division protein FtsW [Rhodothermaceae bacterium]|nr:FtsW/RodA/SpoVE family cell cycle protein [Bacteroidota bacterium]MXW82633.1 cell division protein FtsW [Rhodothermaceae bacterium]MXX57966.1 cell division protein FtsW [Rhodothermaceae bacterium]MXZ05780.1 cell division protein FtsW [Rhodothermaceae bacterium]MYD19956.1 cell division protein FtsW [Rhodothermaceae bacterium]
MNGLLKIFPRHLRNLHPLDKYVLWIALVLSAVGIMAVYSAIAFLAEVKAGGDTELFLVRHSLRVGLALIALTVFSMVDYHHLARWSRFFLIGSLLLLVFVRIFGVTYGGATRAFHVGMLSVQPSDLAKISLILYIAVLLVRKQTYIQSFSRTFLPLSLWIFATVGLIGLEDVSTAFLVLVSVMLMAFVGRFSLPYIGSMGAFAVIFAALMLLGSPNRAQRLESYFGVKIFPHSEEVETFSVQAEGYQARQAHIALAMGGLTGRGPGKSVQRDFLPAPYNDFIFAIITEEYGLLGGVALLALFVVLLFRGFLRIARHATDPLGLFIAVGCTVMLTLYGFVHAGVAVGLLPVTGLPLPLVSYGGTSMISAGTLLGILLNISRQIER